MLAQFILEKSNLYYGVYYLIRLRFYYPSSGNALFLCLTFSCSSARSVSTPFSICNKKEVFFYLEFIKGQNQKILSITVTLEIKY